jgi:hypothetical protein
MKTILAAVLISLTAVSAAAAQGNDCCDPQPLPQAQQPQPVPQPLPGPQPAPQVQPTGPDTAFVEPAQPPMGAEPTAVVAEDDEEGWHKPVGRRFLHGFRIGWTYIYNMDKVTRDNGKSLAMEFDLKSPNMMLLGYEGFYRIVGHSWLNVLLVGNVTVAGLEQSKFIPAASGLLGFEFQKSFQLGVGVNVTPDPEAPTHMIAAAGWTPKVGSIHTPVHFFFVPDTEHNHRMGATIGMSW